LAGKWAVRLPQVLLWQRLLYATTPHPKAHFWSTTPQPILSLKDFEDLPVWNAAIDLSVRLFEMTGTGGLNGYAGLRAIPSNSDNAVSQFSLENKLFP
jgi:hypothetical protein